MSGAGIDRRYAPATIAVRLEPEGRELVMQRPKTVMQLLRKLGIRRCAALVIRDGGLLTEDRRILPDEHITVRLVTSSG